MNSHEKIKSVMGFWQEGQYNKALNLCKEILKFEPNNLSYINLSQTIMAQIGKIANNLYDKGRFDEAVLHYKIILSFDYANIPALFNIGNAYYFKNQFNNAISSYNAILSIEPNNSLVLFNMGNVFYSIGKLNEALLYYQKTIRIMPNNDDAYNNIGIIWKDQGKFDEAIYFFKKALSVNPNNFKAYNNMGSTYEGEGKNEEAVLCYQQSIEIKSDFGIEVRMALMLPIVSSSKEMIEKVRNQLNQNLEILYNKGEILDDPNEQVGTTAFYLAYHGLNDKDLQKKIAFFYIKSCPHLGFCSFKSSYKRSNKIKIGFISQHLHHLKEQTIGKLNRGIIANLSREKFFVTVFKFDQIENEVATFIDGAADKVVILPTKLNESRKIIAEQNLDILYYLDIGMDSLTYFLAFSRLAPVQCVTWGHPVTTGLPNMDYFISSKDLETPFSQEHYTEKLVKLERLSVYYYYPKVPKIIPNRKKFGIPHGFNIYACPQSIFKFHPDFDYILGSILEQDSKAIIVLLEASHKHIEELMINRFSKTFAKHIDRIFFVSKMGHSDFMEFLMLPDVLLDPPHFGGGNTSYESFACGTPVVTWPGHFMKGRITYALYKRMGIMDCVANDFDAYVSIALKLANDKLFREEVSGKIKQKVHMLFEDIESVKQLELFFEGIIKLQF
ncbi:MAG: tetratricopeptide repeat protein [Desulfobacterales bacterium]|nr:tetratricopeptide repeat protein [Desulfobacterales bacterium]